MDWYDKKTRRNVFRTSSLLILLVVICLFYVWYRKENLSEYQRQDSDLHPENADSAPLPSDNMRIAVEREIDSIKKASGGDAPSSFYIQVNPSSKLTDSSVTAQVASPKKMIAKREDTKTGDNSGALHAPDALFSHTYTIAAGKTIPVDIQWTEDGAKSTTYKLVTVKVEDIANKKARFTIEDPFNVLLFSQTGYGVNDKIIIADEKHNLAVSVLDVKPNSVVIKLVSHLNEGIVGKLQKVG